MKYLLLLIIALSGTTGQILMKIGASKSTAQLPKIDSIKSIIDIISIFIRNNYIIGAVIIYGLGFFLWIFTLTKFDLSYAFPIVAVVYVLVLFSSWYFLHEDITALRIIGSIIIMIGVVIVMQTNK